MELFFFFFICSFKIGERMFVIFYSFCGGLKRDWVFWQGLFRNLKLFGIFVFLYFLLEGSFLKCTALDILTKSINRRIDITFVSVFEYLLIFSLFLPFLFSFLFFIRFYCDLLMLFMSTVVFNWICKICLFFVTEARHIDKLLHQFHKCKGNKFEK